MKDFNGCWSDEERARALDFCKAYFAAPQRQRFVLGRNVYARAITAEVAVAAFVDDFTDLAESDGIPVIRSMDLPDDALVLVASGGMPLTAASKLDRQGIRNLDYFAFYRWSGLNLPEAVFNEGFSRAVEENREAGRWLSDLFEDEESQRVLRRLFSFRGSYNLRYLRGFRDCQEVQYFEDFLPLDAEDAVFVDVGGFDGQTTREFVRRVPGYEHVYVFEPDQANFQTCSDALRDFDRISLLPVGAGRKEEVVRFSQAGSASSIDPSGDIEIRVRKLDDLVSRRPTYIKMDIEGAELDAIAGASATIRAHKPVLAICVYHSPSDFWEIPKAVFKIQPDYKVYLRHYTESIYETVMYFVPYTKGF